MLTLQAVVLALSTLWLFRLKDRYGIGLFLVGIASLHAIEVQTSVLTLNHGLLV
ncbi:hypothetical protein HC761_00905, partial [bacterium]|nr:hypothetical protein [bacterium]